VTANNNKKFFLGTDTAPHLITDKESSCGCAGIFNAPYCLPIITQIFDNLNALKNLEKFVSLNGANHYKISKNKSKIMLKKKNRALTFKNSLSVKNSEIIIFQPDFPVYWDVETKL
jgi:dihydroorotase